MARLVSGPRPYFHHLAGLLLVVSLATAMALPAASSADELSERRVYFACDDAHIANTHGEGTFGWSDEAPQAPMADGSGCTFLGVQGDPYLGQHEVGGVPISAAFEGTVEGGLDALTVRLWNLDVSRSRSPGVPTPGLSIFVWLTVDGVASLDRREVILEPVSEQQLWRQFQFTVTDLGFAEGNDDARHHIELRLGVGSRTEASFWAFGASDVPSGLDFNPRDPAEHVVPAAERP